VGAYQANDDVANLLNCATHIEDQPVELLCGLHPDPRSGADSESIGVQIRGCLAGLGTGAYLALSTLGIKRILLRTDACHLCQWHSLAPEVHTQAERANRFLSIWDRGETITCLDQIEAPVEHILWEAKNPPLSRRDLFRLMARQGQVAMARAMENSIKSSARMPGRDRIRLLSAVTHLPDPQGQEPTCLDGFNFATLTISQGCTACGTCAKACPTEALKFEKNEDEMTFSITFLASNCVNCSLCDHVCVPDAIHFDHAPTFQDIFGADAPVMVESGQLVRCERCRSLMAKHEDVRFCPLCEYRRTHPFGSLMPKKVLRNDGR
jgi:ferredoxin